MGTEGERIRLVVMGDRRVGKTCLVRQFLFTTFQDKYKPTVEDLYSEDFNVGESKLKVDVLDTAGDDQFPVMRRLSINSGHAFLLVYSVTEPSSLELVQSRIEEIQQQRADFKELPIVIAGNKVDLASDNREIFVEDVMDWASYTIPTHRLKVLECSAKDTYNVNNVFKAFLELSNIPIATTALRRGASAYAKLRATNQADGSRSLHKRIKSLKLPTRFSSEKKRPSSNPNIVSSTPSSLPDTPPSSLPSSPVTDCSSSSPRPPCGSPVFDFSVKTMKKNEKGVEEDSRKPRSRSLVRRSSKKIRRKVNESKPEDCIVS